ncbi:hypothetical protein MRB53_037873 [Persea americana]|nr:hypothetical protein MRB53_037873 [Persea americana]
MSAAPTSLSFAAALDESNQTLRTSLAAAPLHRGWYHNVRVQRTGILRSRVEVAMTARGCLDDAGRLIPPERTVKRTKRKPSLFMNVSRENRATTTTEL